MTKPNCTRMVAACFIGYIVQAIVCTLAPLLFVTFSDSYGIPMTKSTLLVTVNYLLQLSIDLIAARFAKHISYRALAVAAQLLSGACPSFQQAKADFDCREFDCQTCWQSWLESGKPPVKEDNQ